MRGERGKPGVQHPGVNMCLKFYINLTDRHQIVSGPRASQSHGNKNRFREMSCCTLGWRFSWRIFLPIRDAAEDDVLVGVSRARGPRPNSRIAAARDWLHVFLLWLPKSIFIARHLWTEFIIWFLIRAGSRDVFGRAVERKLRVAPSSGCWPSTCVGTPWMNELPWIAGNFNLNCCLCILCSKKWLLGLTTNKFHRLPAHARNNVAALLV